MFASDFDNTSTDRERIQISDLATCPTPAARYLEKAGVLGQQRRTLAHITHSGEFRLKPKQRWFPIIGDYRFSPEKPSFIWKASIKVFPLIFVSVTDEYEDGVGKNHVKLESLLTLGNSTGPQVNESSLGRLLSEFVLIPTALVPSDQIRWEPVNRLSAQAVLTNAGMKAVATFDFNDDGLPWRVTIDRFASFAGKTSKLPFVVKISEFQVFEGLLLPTDVVGSWLTNAGEFTWLHFKIESATFH